MATKKQEYSIAQLRAHCVELFGLEAYAFDGAMLGADAYMTVEDAQKRIETWKNGHAVSTGGGR